MRNRLPPVAAMRALEAAARLSSYTRAAEELYVTQSAISHQIRHIEDLWDLKLFIRKGRQLRLTENGQTIVPIIRRFMAEMRSTLEELTSTESTGSIKISLVQSFAFKWLVPRLERFNKEYPNIDVWLSTSDNLVDFASDSLDMAIRLGYGHWPGVTKTLLLRELVFPVASPRFLERHGHPSQPSDLLNFPLLRRQGEDICPRWRDWFKDAGIKERVKLPRGSRFSDTGMAVQAAVDGLGVALARSAHVEDDLRSGRLVQLFDIRCRSFVAYYIVMPEAKMKLAHVVAFRDWLIRQASLSQRIYDGSVTSGR